MLTEIKKHYYQELMPIKIDSKECFYFEKEAKEQGIDIPQDATDSFFCIDCGRAISEGDILVLEGTLTREDVRCTIKAIKAGGLELEYP